MKLTLLFAGGAERNIELGTDRTPRDIRLHEDKRLKDFRLHQIIVSDKDMEPILITL